MHLDSEGDGVGVEFGAPVSIDPRRSGAALWVFWSAGGAFGGGLATLFVPVWLGTMVSGSGNPTALPYDLRFLAYFGTFAAIVALFQSFLLILIAPRKRAALLWLPATVIGASLFYRLLQDLVFNVSLTGLFAFLPPGTASAIIGGAFEATYALALGLAQGLVLVLVTARKAALAAWIAGNLIALPISNYLYANTYVAPAGSGASFIASSAISHGAAAAVTGLVLLFILRPRRRDRRPLVPTAGLQSQG